MNFKQCHKSLWANDGGWYLTDTWTNIFLIKDLFTRNLFVVELCEPKALPNGDVGSIKYF